MAGRMALMIGQRPSDILGFTGSEIERFVLDAMILSQAIEETRTAARQPQSTKELVRKKRAGWRPPRGGMIV